MAYQYLAGVTAPAAPDAVADWFATFESWITGTVGWSMANRVSDTEFILQSSGEVGGLLKLFMHVWKDPVNPTRLRIELQDDVGGTHATTRDNYCDSGGAQFGYFMGADKDAAVICWKEGINYRTIYAGLVMPFALSVTDETYSMVVAAPQAGPVDATILRNHDNAWDQNITLYYNAQGTIMDRCSIDGNLPIFGLLANRYNAIAGELNHISCRIQTGGINLEDTLDTGYPGATTSWICLANMGLKFCLRTGGDLPVGIPDGANYASATGVTTSGAHFLDTVLVNFLTGIGWTDLGDPGSPKTDNRLFFSAGENGLESIYILCCWDTTGIDYFHAFCQDDAVGTHRTLDAWSPMRSTYFPANYILAGDRDCICWAVQIGTGEYPPIWQGKVTPFNPALQGAALSPYSMCVYMSYYDHARSLRAHDGTWSQNAQMNWHWAEAQNSNPNAFDGTTYLKWPRFLTHTAPHPINEGFGVCRYANFSHGGGVAQMDTITIAGKVYTLVDEHIARPNNKWAIRTT